MSNIDLLEIGKFSKKTESMLCLQVVDSRWERNRFIDLFPRFLQIFFRRIGMFFNPKTHIKIKSFSRGTWIDTDEQIFHFMFEAFERFIRKEEPFGITDFTWDDNQKKIGIEFLELWEYWDQDPFAKNLDNPLHVWNFDTMKEFREAVLEKLGIDHWLYQEIQFWSDEESFFHVDVAIKEKRMEMMKRLIDVSDNLWT